MISMDVNGPAGMAPQAQQQQMHQNAQMMHMSSGGGGDDSKKKRESQRRPIFFSFLIIDGLLVQFVKWQKIVASTRNWLVQMPC